MGADVTEIGFNQSEFRLFVRPREIAFVDKGPFWNFSFCSSVRSSGMQRCKMEIGLSHQSRRN